MRTMNRFTALQVARLLKKPRKTPYPDGGQLYLQVQTITSASWLFRYERGGVETWMGCGGARDTTLGEARARAADARKRLARGEDPLAARRASEAAAKGVPSFGEVADSLIASMRSGWRNRKQGDQWRSSLDQHARVLRDMPVDAVETVDVMAVLRPVWTEKPETGSRLRGRIERVLNAAKAKGYRSGENPAAWRGHLENLLPKRQKLTRGHHAALPYNQTPEFVVKLRAVDTTAARALELVILTASRLNEVLGMKKDEVDIERRLWVVPPTRIKSGKPHRVPLCDRAMEIVREASAASTSDYVFGGALHGRPVSATALTVLLKRLARDVTIHGFRSSFRDWAGDRTAFPRELAEAALAHVVGDAVEQAYRRGDALERRREMMTEWSDFIDRTAGGDVLQFSRPT